MQLKKLNNSNKAPKYLKINNETRVQQKSRYIMVFILDFFTVVLTLLHSLRLVLHCLII